MGNRTLIFYLQSMPSLCEWIVKFKKSQTYLRELKEFPFNSIFCYESNDFLGKANVVLLTHRLRHTTYDDSF